MKKFTILMIALLVAAMGFAQVQMAYKVAPGKQYKAPQVNTTSTANAVRNTRDNTTIFTEGFEFTSDELENGWTSVDQDGDGNNWFLYDNESVGSTVSHSGEYAIASASWRSGQGALTPNNWLISPAIDLSAQSGTIKLSYYIKGQDVTDFREHYKVAVSTTNTEVASFTTKFEETLNSNAWDVRTIDLSEYAGQTIYIAFVHCDVTNMFYLVLDDVTVFLDNSTDAAVTAVAGPSHGDYTTCALTNAEEITVSILNNGGAAISNFEVSYSINDGAPVTETVTTSIAPAATYDYTFTQPADLSNVGSYTITASVNLTGDETTDNNSASMSISNGDATIRIHAFTDNGGGQSWVVTNTLTDNVVAERTSRWEWDVEINDYTCVDASQCYNIVVNDADGMEGDTYVEILYNGTQVAGSTEPGSFTGPSLVAERIGSGCSTDPEIIAATTAFTFSGIVNEASASQSTTIRTYNITEEITATTEAPFEVSADNTTFGATAQLAAENSTLYIRYNPTEAGTQNGTVVLSYTGAENVTITVTGTAISCDPITDLPYTQTFDELSECWGVISNNTANANDLGIYALAEDNNVFRFSSFSRADDYNQYLITPRLGYDNAVKLTFEYANSSSSNETFAVLVSSTNRDIASFTMLGEEVISSSTEMTEYEAIIPAGTKYVAINYYSNYKYRMYVDNLMFSELAANEIELVNVSLSEESGCGLTTVTPTITVKNNGLNAISTFTASYTVNDGDAVNETATIENPIESGETYAYTFTNAIDISELGEYEIAVTIAMEGDADDTNNDAEASISNLAPEQIPYENEFATEEDVLGFHFIDADDDDNTWELDEDEGALYINSSEANDYAITSCITVEEAGDYVFDFDYEAGYYDDSWAAYGYIDDYKENFQIVYGTAPTVEAMTNVIATFTDAYAEDYVNARRIFNIATAGTYYFGILCNSTDGDHIYIDNIAIYPVPTTPEIELTSVTPETGSIVRMGEEFNIGGTIINNGVALTSYKVSYTVDNGDAVEYTVNEINVALGETHNFTHNIPVVVETTGDHTIVVTVSNPNGTEDSDDSNNSMTITVNAVDCTATHTAPWTETFNANSPSLYCWDIIDANNDGISFVTAGTSEDDENEQVMLIPYAGQINQNDYLVSPELEIGDNQKIEFKVAHYAYQGTPYVERYEVYAIVGTEQTLIKSEAETTTLFPSFETVTVELGDYANQTIKIAIKCTSYDAYYFIVDDFSLLISTSAEENIAEAISVYPNPTSDMVTIANAEGKDIVVINSLGQVVASIENAAANQTIDVSNFANGTYFVKVDAEVVKLNVVK